MRTSRLDFFSTDISSKHYTKVFNIHNYNLPINTVAIFNMLICAVTLLVMLGVFHHSSGQNVNMSRLMRKPAFCICENNDADQICGNREADQRLCFRYTNSTTPLLPKSKISSLYPYSVIVQPGLCGTWSETPKTGFLKTRLICKLGNMLV